MSQPITLYENPLALAQGWKPYQIAATEYRLVKLYPHFHSTTMSRALNACLVSVSPAAGLDGLIAAIRQALAQTEPACV